MKQLLGKLHETITRKIRNRGSNGIVRTTEATATYYSTADDQYIGVNFEKASTIYLPTAVPDGKIIVIKSEMTPPLTPRKVIIATVDGSKIDGYTEDQISVSHDVRSYIYHRNNWHRII